MNNPTNFALGKKLLNLRKEYKMTQDDVAKILGMSRTSFSKYENGIANPPLQVLRKIADIYNVGLEYLIFDEKMRIRVNDSADEGENEDVPFSRITELKPVEKELICKFRTLPDEEKEKIIESILKSEE